MTAVRSIILYHLRAATASGTSVSRWLLFLYPFLLIHTKEGA
nr:MAG TPA: hypothetical protein [Caudoviricetes sp.]